MNTLGFLNMVSDFIRFIHYMSSMEKRIKDKERKNAAREEASIS